LSLIGGWVGGPSASSPTCFEIGNENKFEVMKDDDDEDKRGVRMRSSLGGRAQMPYQRPFKSKSFSMNKLTSCAHSTVHAESEVKTCSKDAQAHLGSTEDW
jgi:hypothetical protein